MSDDKTNLGHRTTRAAGWLVLARLGVRSIGLVSTILLARLLVPEDFGVVASAMLVVGVLEAVTEFSFSVVLVADRQMERERYDTAWTLNVIRGVAVALVLWALAGPAAAFFGEPRLEAVIPWLALSIAIAGLENVGIVEFQRQLRMDREFVLMVTTKLVSFVATLTLALLWRDFWALVFGTLVWRLTQVIMSYRMHPFRPRFGLAQWRDIFDFSKWMLLSNVLRYGYSRSDAWVIGRIMSSQSLGLYTVAYEISNLVTSELAIPIRRALLPGFSQLADDSRAMGRFFIDSLAVILLVGLPLAAGLGVAAGPLVRVFLGPNWLAAIPLIQVLAFYGCLHLLAANVWPVFLALRRPWLIPVTTGAFVAVVVPLTLWWGQVFGLLGVAWAVTLGNGLMTALMIAIALRLLALPPRALAGVLWRPLVAAAVMVAAVAGLQELTPDGDGLTHHALELAVSVIGGVVAYLGAVLALWRLAGRPNGPEGQVLALAEARLGVRVG